MATILDLFKKNESSIYGKLDTIRIESRGLINPPRGAALLASSPNAIADLIGGQLAGVINGSANRPTDTIFKNNTPFAKPISLFKTRTGLQTAVEADTSYYIKDTPSPASLLGRMINGASSPTGIALNLAKEGINKLGKGKQKSNKLKEALKAKAESGEGYGTQYQKLDIGGKPMKTEHTFSKWYPQYTDTAGKNGSFPLETSVKERGFDKSSWDDANDRILETEKYKTEDDFKKDADYFKYSNQVWVSFKKYGTNEIIPFVGSITGITEDVTPEWSDVKYMGSPFKTYRYGGVERSLKFNLKLYYTTNIQKGIMIKKINFLKSLAFPFDDVIKIKYSGLDSDNSPLIFSPNLINLSIGDMYKNVLGICETLSFSVEDNTTWNNFNPNMDDDVKTNDLYPSIINVSFGMKIIENHKSDVGTVTKYKYNFDGLNDAKNSNYIETTNVNTNNG